jgi:hypothetical protein
MALAAAAQRAMPQPGHLEPKRAQPRAVERDTEVTAMSGHYRPQVLALRGDGQVHASSELVFERLQLAAQALGAGQPHNHELALTGLAAAMRKTQDMFCKTCPG